MDSRPAFFRAKEGAPMTTRVEGGAGRESILNSAAPPVRGGTPKPGQAPPSTLVVLGAPSLARKNAGRESIGQHLRSQERWCGFKSQIPPFLVFRAFFPFPGALDGAPPLCPPFVECRTGVHHTCRSRVRIPAWPFLRPRSSAVEQPRFAGHLSTLVDIRGYFLWRLIP
jgi:hypothetical protein